MGKKKPKVWNELSCGSNSCVFGPPGGMGVNGPCTCLGEGGRLAHSERVQTHAKIVGLRKELVEAKVALARAIRDRDEAERNHKEYFDKSQELAGELETLQENLRTKLVLWQDPSKRPWASTIIKDLCELVGEKPIEYDPDREGVYNRGAGTCQSGMDGECNWDRCPQLRDGEPAKSGRHCPLWKDPEDE